MQSITIDLRNPTEVAHLISRLKRLPWIVLNNFQFLDRGTKKNLLFDLAFFSERPGIRTIIVGAWSNDDYLEEIEPAIAGKYRPVLVPMWLDEELRAAAAQWLGRSKGRPTVATHMDDYLALSHGDISLFRALIESSKVNGESSPLRPESSTPVRTSQALVLGRFRRGLNRTLRAMRAQREAFLTYHAIRLSIRIMHNPRYVSRTTFTASDKYVLSYLNPYTGKPYSDGRIVSVDPEGNPDDIEESVYEVALMNVDIIEHLLEVFHETVQQGSQEIPLTRLVQDFIDVLVPQPIAIDKSKVKAVFLRLEELQRKALIAPPLFLVDGARDTLRIVDRRLFLFLAGVNADDLEDLLEEAQPRKTPRAARRNHVSPHMTDAEKVAYAARVQANVLSTDGETSGLQGSSSGGIYNPDGQA